MIAGKYSENVRLAPEWKFNSPQLVQFLVYFTAELVLIPDSKLYGHRGTWTRCKER